MEIENLAETLFEDLLTGFLHWYREEFLVSLTDFPRLIVKLLAIYIMIQLVFMVLPPVKKLFLYLALPFRYLHVFFHINAAKKLDALGEDNKGRKSVSGMMFSSISRNEYPTMAFRVETTREAYQIAVAPMRGGIALLTISLILTPFLAQMDDLGLFIHLYLFVTTFGVAWPSTDDYMYVYNMAMINTDLIPKYVLIGYIEFVLSLFLSYWKSNDLLNAIIDAFCIMGLYSAALLFIAIRSIDEHSDIEIFEDSLENDFSRNERRTSNYKLEETGIDFLEVT